jgi:hypothetical protein
MKNTHNATPNNEVECRAGSHAELQPQPSADSTLSNYVDWLNEQKFSDRKELIKFLFTIASAVLTFTIAFRKDIVGAGEPSKVYLLQASWLMLLASIIFALVYYILEYRWISYNRARKVVQRIPWTHYAGLPEEIIFNLSVYLTPLSFIVGLVLLTWFVLVNVH